MSAKRGNNEGSVYRRKDGRWVAAVTLEDGRRKNYYAKTRDAASTKLRHAQNDVEGGHRIDVRDQTLGQYLEQWLEGAKPSLKESTWTTYETQVRRHLIPTIGKVQLRKLQPTQLQTLYQRKLESGLSPRSVHYIHAVLRRALGQAERWGMVPRNVARIVDAPKVTRPNVSSMSPDEARRFLAAARGERLFALYALMLTGGLRRGEGLALRWEDIDFERGTLAVRGTLSKVRGGWRITEPKTAQSRRSVRLTTIAIEALKARGTDGMPG